MALLDSYLSMHQILGKIRLLERPTADHYAFHLEKTCWNALVTSADAVMLPSLI